MTTNPKPVSPTIALIADVPRGDTCPGVNRIIAELLSRRFARDASFQLLDIPCGSGDLLAWVARAFSNAAATGCDIVPPSAIDPDHFVEMDLSRADPSQLGETAFDVVTCVSGVMEFANTRAFLDTIRRVIRDDGVLYLTNDNLLTVKDRLLYLLGGRFAQYRYDYGSDLPTWKIMPLQNLLRTVTDAGFRIDDLIYAPRSLSDKLWAPIALPLFAVQKLTSANREYLPYESMTSRHYVLVCRPT
jgi:2-polyprenyl-3-methyl-5-hydroxy-6-metoxy-1,4-benzoquinol methylase